MTTHAQTGVLTVPYKFITIFIITHGEDVRNRTLDSFFNNTGEKRAYNKLFDLFKKDQPIEKHFKLTVSGLTGNITKGSETIDRLYSQIPRILAHNRRMSPLQKLHEVHRKMHNHFHFEYEVAHQDKGQDELIDERNEIGEYQKRARNPNWFPAPTRISYDRAYYFTANPIDERDRTREAPERNQFGIWAVDASLDIATMLEMKPGCDHEPVSLLAMLEINLSTARQHNSRDNSGATITTLFTIIAQLMMRFGSDIHVNVIDITCRYFNWEQQNPHAKKNHDFGRQIQTVGEWLSRISQPLGERITRFGDYLTDETPSATATKSTYTRETVDGVPVEEWYTDGCIKLENNNTNVFELRQLPKGPIVAISKNDISPDFYKFIVVSFGSNTQKFDKSTLFKGVNGVKDIIINGNGIETTHDIEVFYVQARPSVKAFVSLKRKPGSIGIASWVDQDHDTEFNAYLTLKNIDQTARVWVISENPTTFFKKFYDTPFRREAVSPKRKKTRRESHGGWIRKQKRKKSIRRLRLKTNKIKKTQSRRA